ncbi:MAG: GNAT family N-acetyltransferase [Blastochloris sp.]|nr:GNAT family N-acetyltransferase [Blastochloris sp.]
MAGAIVTDDPQNPTWAAVREAPYGTLYLGGTVDRAGLTRLVAAFRTQGGVGISCWPDEPLATMLPPDPHYDGQALFFPSRDSTLQLDVLTPAIPSGYRLARRDAQWFAQSPDNADTLATFGSVEAVLQQTRGIVIVQDDQVVCEAATGAPVQGGLKSA